MNSLNVILRVKQIKHTPGLRCFLEQLDADCNKNQKHSVDHSDQFATGFQLFCLV